MAEKIRKGEKMAFGDYPAEYNPKVHGPYDPARYYGKGKIINKKRVYLRSNYIINRTIFCTLI